MALSAYLEIEGQQQGLITGDTNISGREDLLEVIGFSHSVHAATDPMTGQRLTKLSYLPFTITRAIDSASPGLVMACQQNERIAVFRLQLYRPAPTGMEENYFTIELTDATIVDYRVEMLNNKYPENMQHAAREHVSFSYRELIQESGGRSASFANLPTQ